MHTTYTVRLSIDQRPPRIDVVSERGYLMMLKVGWFSDGRAELLND